MAKPILISGIQPTGKLHIGNYLGALKNFVDLQNSGKYQCYFFVADLHSLTEDFNPKDKQKQTMDVVLSFLAAGIDPKKSKIFIQSQTSEPAELAWILNTITPMGELQRMTQFKEKGETNTGLFTYPVLMAADIILYDAQFVPVGEDQLQHLEFTRAIARKFNNKFGKTFIEPKAILTSIPRLMSLDDPNKKMSKSRPAGCLFLDDSPTAIKEKIMKAVTDSGKKIEFDLNNKPAISNLMKIYEAFSEKSLKNIELEFKNKGYGDFKKSLADIIINALSPFQERKGKLTKNSNQIKNIVKNGNKIAKSSADKKLKEVKSKIGLI